MILIISDTKDGHTWAKALVETGNATEWEDCNAPFLGQSDKRVKEALIYLVNEGVMVHKYDYVWIMRLLNERYKKKDDLFFESIQSYRDYVATYMQIDGIASISTLSKYYSAGEGTFPDWTFTDTKDATERLRRINVAQRFLAFFIKGK
jgi:hypothetical protein